MSLIKSMSKKKLKPSEDGLESLVPGKSSLSMAYAARRNVGKKKMAKGGELPGADETLAEDSIDGAKDEREMTMMAKGGMVDSIMKKRKLMASGGEVDLQENADEESGILDELNEEAAGKDTYFDDSQISEQPEGSNEHGDELSDADAHDMVSMIRKKIKSLK